PSRDTGIPRAYQRKPLGDCEKPSLLEMLVRTRTYAEPTIVCDVHEPSWPLATRDCSPGKNCLVTDQRQHFRRATAVHRPTAIPGKESAYDFGQLHQSQPFKQLLERQIFSEGNQVHLVVYAGDRPLGIDN